MRYLFAIIAATLIGGPCAAKDAGDGFLVTPSEINSERSFKGFRGHDIAAFSGALWKREQALPKKSEYETQVAYQERVDKWKAAAVSGSIMLDSVLAFSMPLARVTALNHLIHPTFDAETARVRVQMTGECENHAGVVMADTEKVLGSYVGSNAFGVKRKVKTIFRTSLCLQLLDHPDWVNFHEPVNIDPATAKAMTRVGHLVLLGTLREPYRWSEMNTSSPTLDDPYKVMHLAVAILFDLQEVLIIDPVTGRVFFRAKKP